MVRLLSLCLFTVLLLTFGCGPSVSDFDADKNKIDEDKDGYTADVDCDDSNPNINPGQPETTNQIDDDCDGIVDNNTPETDDDGDGYAEVDGDCNDGNAFISPGSVEIFETITGAADGVDDNCNGQIDERVVCDNSVGSNAGDFAKAIDICDGTLVSSNIAGHAEGRRIHRNFGNTYVPKGGSQMAVLSTGRAVDKNNIDWVIPWPIFFINPAGILSAEIAEGTIHQNQMAHPDPQPTPGDGCGAADPVSVQDPITFVLDLKVPSNANVLAFDFNFMSSEFPKFVCTDWDDTFVALLESTEFNGNISFDENGRPITINAGFFDVCEQQLAPSCTGQQPLIGTGFETENLFLTVTWPTSPPQAGSINYNKQGGGTGWLKTLAPVVPGEDIRLTFIIFDEGLSSNGEPDYIFDSTVLIDNFRWLADDLSVPVTID